MWKEFFVTFNAARYRIQAKVYDEGSRYGINGGRVSKLWIKRVGGDTVYSYDRGLDFDSAPNGLLDLVLARFA